MFVLGRHGKCHASDATIVSFVNLWARSSEPPNYGSVVKSLRIVSGLDFRISGHCGHHLFITIARFIRCLWYSSLLFRGLPDVHISKVPKPSGPSHR